MPGASSRLAPPLVVLLLLSVALASAWLAHQEDEPPAPPLPDEVLDLPEFNATDHLVVVNTDELSYRHLLAVSSLQGLVNRQSAQIYFDREGELEDPESLLNFVLWRYNLTHEEMTPRQFWANFSSHARGMVVYDPFREETINVARTVAGQLDLMVVHHAQVPSMANLTGLEVKLDLREGKWKGLTDLDLYRKAFDEFYDPAERQPLLGSRPVVELMTDYGVAVGAFFFFLNPGPFTTPGEMALFEHFLRESEPGVPLLGWFDQPTGVEENYLVQKASSYGHFLVGGSRLPNFSLLTAYGRGDLTPPPAVANPPPTPELEAKTYLSFAVTDGDNLEFFVRRGRYIWEQPQRGELPLAWSVSPALAELAPPLLERTYLEASANDTFIAGPSGLGYFYPGFLPEGHLEPMLTRTKGLMDQSHLDSVWLLNSFTTYETPYDDEDLQVYVDELDPKGILIDYGDVPITRPDLGCETPMLRVFHLWGSVENLEAKLSLALSENNPADTGQPYFVVVALMSIDFDLDEIWEVYNSLPDDVEVVALPTMFELTAGYPSLDLTNSHHGENDWIGCSAQTENINPCWHCENAAECRDHNTLFGLILSIIIVMGILFLVCRTSSRPSANRPSSASGGKGKHRTEQQSPVATLFSTIVLASLFIIGLKVTEHLLNSNFWHYGWLGIGLPLAVALPMLGRTRLENVETGWHGPLAGSFLLAGIGLFSVHPSGYAIALPAVVLAGRYWLKSNRPGPAVVIWGLALALVVVNLPLEQGYWMIWAGSLVSFIGMMTNGEDGTPKAVQTVQEADGVAVISLKDQVIAASALVLATLPWYLDRSYFWSNHINFRMVYLEGLSLLVPFLSILLLGMTIRNRDVLLGLLTPSNGSDNGKVLEIGQMSSQLFLLLAGVMIFLGAAMVNDHLLVGYLLVIAEVFWLSSAWLALRPRSGSDDAQATPPSLFLLVLALQALLALWLTIPPVFYAAFVWPGMPVWANHLLYHTPLALAVVGLLALLAAVAVSATRLVALREKTARRAG